MENRSLKFTGRRFGKCIILLGVLTGLVFSAGEGIRLIPFPNTTFSSHGPSQIGNPIASYQHAVQRLKGSSAETRKMKRSGVGDAGDLVAACASVVKPDSGGSSFSRPIVHADRVSTFTSFAKTQSGRGPPAI